MFCFVALFAAPYSVIPLKDGIEELILPDGRRFTQLQNVYVTLGLVVLSYLIAITVPTIADAMTILGATTNSGIGFLLPIVFYLKLISKKPSSYWKQRVFSCVVFVLISCCSVIELYAYAKKKS